MNQSHEKSIITIYYILGAIQPAKQVDLDISIQCRRHNVHAENSVKLASCVQWCNDMAGIELERNSELMPCGFELGPALKALNVYD